MSETLISSTTTSVDIIQPSTQQVDVDTNVVTVSGPPGDKGDPGADGKSAYEIAVANGYPGTEQQWLSSLTMPFPTKVSGVPSGTAREGQVVFSDNHHMYIYGDDSTATD